MPAWAWALPLIIILLATGGFGTWFYLSAQEKAASDARATSTAVAQSNATSTAQAQSNATSTAVAQVAQSNATSIAQTQKTSTAVAIRTGTAVAETTSIAVAETSATAEAAQTATAIEIAFATMLAVQESPTIAASQETPTVAAAEPVRMPVEEFIVLYGDPAKRPIIVDVRSKAAYDEGHIAGAVSIPDAETESRLSEFPKDKLIVAYCQ